MVLPATSFTMAAAMVLQVETIAIALDLRFTTFAQAPARNANPTTMKFGHGTIARKSKCGKSLTGYVVPGCVDEGTWKVRKSLVAVVAVVARPQEESSTNPVPTCRQYSLNTTFGQAKV